MHLVDIVGKPPQVLCEEWSDLHIVPNGSPLPKEYDRLFSNISPDEAKEVLDKINDKRTEI